MVYSIFTDMMLHVVSKHWRTLSSLGEGLGLTSWSSKLQCLHISNSKAYLSTYTKVRNTITWNTVCSNQRWYSMINSDEAEVIENDPPNETDQSGQPPSDSSFSSPYDFEEMLNSIRKKAMTIQEEVPETIHYDDDVNKVVTKVRRARRTNIDSVNIRELVEFIKVDNANDVCVIRIPPEKRYAEYLVICSGVNTKHIQKMAESLAYEVRSIYVYSGDKIKEGFCLCELCVCVCVCVLIMIACMYMVMNKVIYVSKINPFSVYCI